MKVKNVNHILLVLFAIGTAFTISNAQSNTEILAAIDNIHETRTADISGSTNVHTSTNVNGVDQLRNHLIANLNYPEFAREYGIEGKVLITVQINVDGSIGSAELVQGLNDAFDKKVLDTIASIDRVEPITINGRIKNTKILLPIVFEN